GRIPKAEQFSGHLSKRSARQSLFAGAGRSRRVQWCGIVGQRSANPAEAAILFTGERRRVWRGHLIVWTSRRGIGARFTSSVDDVPSIDNLSARNLVYF